MQLTNHLVVNYIANLVLLSSAVRGQVDCFIRMVDIISNFRVFTAQCYIIHVLVINMVGIKLFQAPMPVRLSCIIFICIDFFGRVDITTVDFRQLVRITALLIIRDESAPVRHWGFKKMDNLVEPFTGRCAFYQEFKALGYTGLGKKVCVEHS